VTTTAETNEAVEQATARQVGILVEAKLREWDVPYEYVEEFPISKVRTVEWTQVREAAHIADPETVAEFRTQMSQGATYPPIVLMGPDVLVDGNTRLTAAKGLRRKTFPAFVAQFNQVDLAMAFNAAVNQLGGRRLTSVEAFNAAAAMMARGMADEAVAREIGRSVELVRQMRRKREFADRTTALPGLAPLAKSISERAAIKLATIRHDPAFAEAVKVVAEMRPEAKMVTEIVRAATSARTDADAIDAIRAIRAELAPAGPPPYKVAVPSEVRQSTMHVAGLLKFSANPLSVLDVSTPERRGASIARWRELRDMTAEVLRLYGS
jgi:hypothetical protein